MTGLDVLEELNKSKRDFRERLTYKVLAKISNHNYIHDEEIRLDVLHSLIGINYKTLSEIFTFLDNEGFIELTLYKEEDKERSPEDMTVNITKIGEISLRNYLFKKILN